MTDVLGHVEDSLKDFRPRNEREFVALRLARRFGDLHRLSRYLIASHKQTKRELLAAETARECATSSPRSRECLDLQRRPSPLCANFAFLTSVG